MQSGGPGWFVTQKEEMENLRGSFNTITTYRHVPNILIYRQLHYSLERQLKY